jgi:hypothetical protein
MAVARLDQMQVRTIDSKALRTGAVRPPLRLPVRSTAAGVIVLGTVLQRLLVAAPIEPQPLGPAAIAASAGTGVQVAGLAIAAPKLSRAAPAAAPHISVGALAGRSQNPQLHRAVAPARPAVQRSLSAVLPEVGPGGDDQRTALSPNIDGQILHAPSVSVAEIRAALNAVQSPILSTSYADNKDAAEYIWDAGRVLGVDPAVLLAIFRYESAFGTRGVARITQSVGNIRPLAGQPSYQGYRSYGSWQEGIDDCYRLLLQYARQGATTVGDAIPTWAPADDNNDPAAYVAGVMQIMTELYQGSIAN